MKLIDLIDYNGDNVPGWELNILKFRRRSLISLTYEIAIYQSFPSVLVQIGPSDLFQLSLGLVKGYLSISLWCRHYDD